MAQVEKSTGIRPEELTLPVFPFLLHHIWLDFIEISKFRSDSINGPGPITLRDIKDYMELYGIDLSPYSIQLIHKLDRKFREVTLRENA